MEGVHAPTSWRRHNAGAVVEDRIEGMVQLGAGRTAVDDLGGDRVPWRLVAVALSSMVIVGRS